MGSAHGREGRRVEKTGGWGPLGGRIGAQNVPCACTVHVWASVPSSNPACTLRTGTYVLAVDFNFCFQRDDAELGPRSRVSLLDQHTELKKAAEGTLV